MRERTLAVLGPGTGLGVAAVTLRNGAPLVLETEGGHASFAPVDAEEVAILGQLARRFGRVSWERVLSGPGLANIDAALRAIAGVTGEPLAPEAVTARAAAGDDPIAVRSVEVFCALLGAFAGDVALLYGAWDGVFIAGGIAPTLAGPLAAGPFSRALRGQGPLLGTSRDGTHGPHRPPVPRPPGRRGLRGLPRPLKPSRPTFPPSSVTARVSRARRRSRLTVRSQEITVFPMRPERQRIGRHPESIAAAPAYE